MALTFADTHNMIAYLTKLDASEGFDQIIDFLNASLIKYALTVNPNIYVSCIKQFWSSVSVKKVNDVTRLQALVDRKKVIITEATIQEALRLDDAQSIYCLPTEEIFTELSRMGYEKPSTKLTFYKAFFSPQWNLVRNVDSSTKFYMYPRFLQLMIRTQVGDLSSHSTKYSSLALTQKVFANMRRVGKGFSGVDTPLFEGMIVAQQADEGVAGVDVDAVPAAVDALSISSPTPTTQPPPPSQELPSTLQDKIAQTLEITKLKQMVKKLERRNKLKVSKPRRLKRVGTAQRVDTSEDTVMDDVSKQGEIIATMDADEDVILKDVAVVAKELERNEKEDNAVMRYQALKRKPQTKAQARKNIMIYLRNIVGFKMDYFKGMSYDDIRPIFEKEDLEVLWQLVKERFASSKPKNFSDDFLLTTLTYMFEKHDVQAQVWKNQRTVHGLAKICEATTARRIQTRVVFGYILHKDQTYCCQYKLMLLDNAADTELRLLEQSDVTRLQALVDKKKIMISEAVIRKILQLNDAEGVICLPNEDIFTCLAQMGYEKPVRKGFSGVETPLFEGMADRQPAEEELGAKQVQVDDAVAAAVVEDVVKDVAEDVAHVATP
nr:xylulose kinase-1 [Tanacetum cinerariifolium]